MWYQTQQYVSFKVNEQYAYLAKSSHDIWIESPDKSIVAGQQVQAGDEFWICTQIIDDRTLNGGESKGYLHWTSGVGDPVDHRAGIATKLRFRRSCVAGTARCGSPSRSRRRAEGLR